MSDPEKRKKYDKYGTVDEDDWDFQDFMKNFNLENMFNLFEDDMMFDPTFGDTGKQMRHGVKLMFIRKQSEKAPMSRPLEEDDEVDSSSIKYRNGLPYDIYGKGEGLDTTIDLMWWVKKEKAANDEWEELEDTNKKAEDSDDGEEIEEEDYLQNFMEDNVKENKTGKLNCRLCDKKFSFENATKHYVKNHQKEYEASTYAKEVSWKDAVEANKRIEKKMEDEFMKMTGGFAGFDDGGDDDFDFSSMFKGPKGKSTGKGKGKGKDSFGMEEMLMEMMMGGMPGMGAGMGGMPGIPGMGGSKPSANKRKKKK